ncbi:GNAT family N-acetyltransferase [Rhizobium mongolense]|uniref:TolA-binding protein n=2 Tax=Rhizobium mongolense TaxID=57676 RepID=A0ABR6IV97_9HYPH|nr:GNAT family N-acetyltransferase [Rhizobium mongolense]MBB4231605.1 TolA-binding protein [Rhizobium mongolense]TVZ64184.1 CelD/BcsL family acetyltransferase involved in cellulose biosynthesis [Rhizobium mongolense USDA 1844]
MRIDVIDTEAGFEAVREDWDRVYMDDPHAQHFLSWIWLKSYLFHRKRWFILALREREDRSPYVAFFPLRVTTQHDKKTGVFFDEIIMAGNFSADYTGFIAQPDYEHHAIAGFAAYLKRQNWTHLKLEYFSGPPERREALVRALQGPEVMFRDSSPRNPENIDNCICPVVTLPPSFDDYLEQKMSSQTRQKLRRFLRKVEGDDDYRITMATPETIDRDLDILFELWRTKWIGRKGKERTERLIGATRQLLMDSFKDGNLDVPVMWYGDRPLGALANIIDRQKKSILFYITGRDETWKTPSPGLILHGYCIRRAITDGFKTYDFLRGNEPYKYMFGPDERRISCTLFRTRSGRNLGDVIHPRSIRFVYDQALQMYRDGAKAFAEAAFRQLLETVPSHMGAEFGLASLMFEKGKLHEAEAGFTALIGRIDDPNPVYLRLGDTQLALGSYDEAARTFGRIIERSPYDAQAHYKQGVALAAAGRQPEAARVFAMVEQYNYDNPLQRKFAEKSREALRRIVSETEQAAAAPVAASKGQKTSRRNQTGRASAKFERGAAQLVPA